MPRTKFQNVVFTAIMAFFMVFGMTVYSITVQTGELTYGTLIAAITEMWIEYVIVFLIVEARGKNRVPLHGSSHR